MDVLSDGYITDIELNHLREEYGRQICLFGTISGDIREHWYKRYSFRYPHGSYNNYRDSWFHYRKMYTERSLCEMIGQASNFKEHLQRAEKDAVISFLQEAAMLIEYWYVSPPKLPADILDCGEQKECLEIYDNDVPKSGNDMSDDEWATEIFEYFRQKDANAEDENSGNRARRKAAAGCVYCMEEKIFRNIENFKNFKTDAQEVLHKMKKMILKIRFSGADIKREPEPGNYYEQCKKCYQEFDGFCKRYKIVSLIGMSEEIVNLV